MNHESNTNRVMFILVSIGAIALVLFLLAGCVGKGSPGNPVYVVVTDTTRPAAAPKPPRTLVTDKQALPGYWHMLRAQTGAKTVTMPAWVQPVYKLQIFTDSAGITSLQWRTVSQAVYLNAKKGGDLYGN